MSEDGSSRNLHIWGTSLTLHDFIFKQIAADIIKKTV
jgi:hypothetical protein